MEQQEIQTLRALMEYEAARTEQTLRALMEYEALISPISLRGATPTPVFLNWNKPRFLKSRGSSPRTSMRYRNLAVT